MPREIAGDRKKDANRPAEKKEEKTKEKSLFQTWRLVNLEMKVPRVGSWTVSRERPFQPLTVLGVGVGGWGQGEDSSYPTLDYCP